MNLIISQINQEWLEKLGTEFGVPPSIVLNAILEHLRYRDQSGKQSLPDWIDSYDRMEIQTAEALEQARKVLSQAEMASKAAQLYLHLIETNKGSTTTAEA